MSGLDITRRHFAGAPGAALGASLVAPDLARSAPAPANLPAARPHSRLPPGTVRIDSNENPYGPSPGALAAMGRSQSVAARYPDALEDRVGAALAQLHGVTPDNVILGCGSGEILRMADMAFLGPGKNVVAAEPTFEAVLLYAGVTRAQPVKVPLTADHRHDLPRMAAACGERTGLVYVCNPNNPTGTIVTRDELAPFLGRLPKTSVVLVDEAYHHFVEDARYASAFEWVGKVPNLLVVRTFSKIYGLAGMRLGYGVGSRETIEARRWLCAEIHKDGRAHIPSEANFVMIDVGSDVEPVIAALRDRHILVGRKFPSLPGWLRVSIGTPEEMKTFLAGLRAVVPRAEIRAA